MALKLKEGFFSPLLAKLEVDFPESFYVAFYLVFGSIESEARALDFLESLNYLMDQEKGGILRKKDIILLRDEEIYFNGHGICPYNGHHVIPKSRTGKNGNGHKKLETIKIPEEFHSAWHMIFVNLYDDETVVFLDKFFFFSKNCESFNYLNLNKIINSSRDE